MVAVSYTHLIISSHLIASLREICDIIHYLNEGVIYNVPCKFTPVSYTHLLTIEYDQPSARALGLSRNDVSLSLLTATGGIPIGSFYEGIHKNNKMCIRDRF